MSSANGAGRPAILLDVDNTLLDNDQVQSDLGTRIEQGFGLAVRERSWVIYAPLRTETGSACYRGACRTPAAVPQPDAHPEPPPPWLTVTSSNRLGYSGGSRSFVAGSRGVKLCTAQRFTRI